MSSRLAGNVLRTFSWRFAYYYEAIADFDLFICHFHFSELGSLDDLNVFNKSSIVRALLAEMLNMKIDQNSINGNE